MQGKKIFTTDEASRIRALLDEKRWASRDQQKILRAKIRRIEFYISDFTSSVEGFTTADFDALVTSGRVVIRE